MVFFLNAVRTLRPLRNWLLPDSFALKWSCPLARDICLPFLVILILSVNVLLTLIYLLFFYNNRESFRTSADRVCDFVCDWNNLQYSLQPLPQKLLVKKLRSAREKKLNLHAIPFPKPLSCLFRLQR